MSSTQPSRAAARVVMGLILVSAGVAISVSVASSGGGAGDETARAEGSAPGSAEAVALEGGSPGFPAWQAGAENEPSPVNRMQSGATATRGDAAMTRGAVLYEKYCSICHGENGDGAGKFAYLMNPRPRDFTEGNFKLATTQNLVPSDDDLLRTIRNGMPGSAMPPWGQLPDTDLNALVQYVRKFHVDATRATLESWVADGELNQDDVPRMLADRTEPGPALLVPPEPEFDQVRWFRGQRLYLENCASCHGASGEPVPEAVKYDALGYPVPPRSFVSGIFKGGMQGEQLYARILKGMKGTPMPASEGNYTDDELWDVVHYVQSLARQGAQERAQLQEGTFVAARISGSLPSDPVDEAWDQARSLYVSLTPLWWTEQRVEGVLVQALHNGEDLAIRLRWIDPTQDDRAVRQEEFHDAVGIQFSLSADPPFYMGDATEHGGVNIWMWKANRQKNLAGGYQDVDTAYPDRAIDGYQPDEMVSFDPSRMERRTTPITDHLPLFITAWGAGNLVANPELSTSVECLVARGPGTLSSKPANVQIVDGQAAYERGVWYVQMQRSMALPHEHGEADERAFASGDYLPVSFAIWDGSAGDRDGKKNISIWQKLVIQ